MEYGARFRAVGLVLLVFGFHTAGARSAAVNPADGGDFTVCSAPKSLDDARAKARKLIAQIRADLANVENQIRGVEFIEQVETGRAPLARVAAVVAEEFSIIRSDLNSFNQMAARWDTANGSHFFGDLASGEALAAPLVLEFSATVGLSETDLVKYEPRPKSQTYPSRVVWIASNADRAAAAVSFLVNFAVFGENMGRVRDALLYRYGFAPDQVKFFTYFAEPIPGFEDAAVEVIANGLLEGSCPRDARRSARLLQAYELEFWQAASDPPGSPLAVKFPRH